MGAMRTLGRLLILSLCLSAACGKKPAPKAQAPAAEPAEPAPAGATEDRARTAPPKGDPDDGGEKK